MSDVIHCACVFERGLSTELGNSAPIKWCKWHGNLSERLQGSLNEVLRQLEITAENDSKHTAQRDRLAEDALIALAGAGIPTPEKGYKAEPHCLMRDIEELQRQRDRFARAIDESGHDCEPTVCGSDCVVKKAREVVRSAGTNEGATP